MPWNQKLKSLDPTQRARILSLRDEGITIDAIARRYSVSVATVSRTCDAAKVAKVGARREGSR
jgi:DNA invertase Pin-like site-specific DNA recombinase